MRILGINEGIEGSIVILKDGQIEFALQEERVTRKKTHFGFPENAIQFALDYLKLSPSDFQAICLSNRHSPIVTKAEFLAGYDLVSKSGGTHPLKRALLGYVPPSLIEKRRAARGRKRNSLIERKAISTGLPLEKIVRAPHHSNHAACAYYGLRQNPCDPHLVLTLDGGGDHVCSQVYIAENGKMRLIAETPDGHSIGNIYSRVTHYMGMTPHEHEYKLMGLSAYQNNDKYIQAVQDLFLSYLDLSPENPLVFQCKVPELTYAIQKRLIKDLSRVRFDNLAAGLQAFTENLMVRWVQEAVRKTGIRKVVAAGGVFMNVKANKRIAELPEVEFFDVFPSCGDETLPFGAVWQWYAKNSPTQGEDIQFDSFYLGPDGGFDLAQAKQRFKDSLEFTHLAEPEAQTARLLAEGKVVARCSDRMEFGARALGNRSILADPGIPGVVPEINRMIKQRDFWMPFAPAMLKEEADRFVRIPRSLPSERVSPYMMHSFDSTDLREQFFAGIHAYDKTARAQIVHDRINPSFHKLIREFSKLKQKGVVLNTSFNLHGFPIVMGTQDAAEVMLGSNLQYLVVNDTLITKRTASA